jgi:hypothetical protein
MARIIAVGALPALFACIVLSVGEAAAQSSLRPLLYIEADPDGTRYVRVMEPNDFAFAPARRIVNLMNNRRINIRDALATLVRNVTVRNARYGVHIAGPGPVSVDNFTYIDWSGDGIHGAAVKIDRPTEAVTYIERVFADGMESPDPTYARSNTDFIGIERHSGSVHVRYATGRNFGDAGIDAKSNVALMNVTVDGAHRGLRAWSNVTITIVNAIVNVPAGQEQVWVQGPASRVRYYNVLWCIGSTNASPDDPRCTTAPTAIGAEGVSAAQARRQIVALSANPLPRTSPFFATQIDRIIVEYSRNGGADWQAMVAAGARGRPPCGDTRYRIPFNLASATYLFRARFERNGARVGASATINEAGQSVTV